MDGNSTTEASATPLLAGEAWFDPIEAGLRERIRGFIEELLEQELTEALGGGGATDAARPRGTGTATGGGG
jgi:hypothetical protein